MAAQDVLQRTYDNYAACFLLCTEVIVSPSQANVAALVSTAVSTGVVQPKPTYTLDGESYNWLEYQQGLGEIMASVRRQMVMAAGPWESRSQIY